MTVKPLIVSIIINNYNYGRYLPQALESALGQTYPHVEVIAVDDGSTDDSRAILRRYAGRVHVIFQPNRGQASALNAGLAQSRGDIVIFLDADDVLSPGVAQRVAEAFAAQPRAARVHYRMQVIDAAGRPTGRLKPPSNRPLVSGDLQQQVLRSPDDMAWLPTSGNAFSARVLRQIFPIPEAPFRILADYYLSHLTPLYGPLVALDEIGAAYRVHGANQHEVAAGSLDLAQLRRTLTHWAVVHGCLAQHAQRLGLPLTRAGVLSMAFVANRMISLRLDPVRHPWPEDTRGRLVRLGLRAAAQRLDVSAGFKVVFAGWLLGLAAAPRSVAAWLARLLLMPEARPAGNAWLAALHRQPPASAPAAPAAWPEPEPQAKH